MTKQKTYSRQRVGKCIIKVLQDLGGSASKQRIKDEIVADKSNDISYDDVFTPVTSAKVAILISLSILISTLA